MVGRSTWPYKSKSKGADFRLLMDIRLCFHCLMDIRLCRDFFMDIRNNLGGSGGRSSKGHTNL